MWALLGAERGAAEFTPSVIGQKLQAAESRFPDPLLGVGGAAALGACPDLGGYFYY